METVTIAVSSGDRLELRKEGDKWEIVEVSKNPSKTRQIHPESGKNPFNCPIKPCTNNLILELIDDPQDDITSKGGILIPRGKRRLPLIRAKIVRIGEDIQDFDLKLGDIVLISKWAGSGGQTTSFEWDNKVRYRVVEEDELWAVVEE